MKRFLGFILFMLTVVPNYAQREVYEGFDIYNFEDGKDSKGCAIAFEMGIGTEFELAGRVQYNIGKYVAIDVLTLKYAYDYNKKVWGIKDNWNEFTLQTGVRGFTPTFSKGLKAFAAFDLGYGIAWKNASSSHFALDITIGSYVWNGLYVGYGIGPLCGHGNHTDHLLKIGYEF